MDTQTDLDTIPLIPRETLFGNPEKAGAQISPDGAHISFLAPLAGVMNVFVARRGALDQARPLTSEPKRGIPAYAWAQDNRHLLVLKDSDGDENWHVHAVNIETGTMRDLTPHDGAQASIAKLSHKHPGAVLVSHNARNKQFPDVYRIDIASGAQALVAENPGLAGFSIDDDFAVRFAVMLEPDGSQVTLRADGIGGWAEWYRFAPEDAMNSGIEELFAPDGTTLMRSSTGRDTAALYRLDLEAGTTTLLAEDASADIGGVLTRLHTNEPLAYAINYERNHYVALTPEIQPDLDFLDNAGIGDWSVQSRTEDDTLWIIGADADTAPAAAWLYDRSAKTIEKLYDTRPALAGAPLASMRPVIIPSRDGLNLVSYLTLPRSNHDAETLPLVLLVHGGPWARDDFGFNRAHQWLANRGYAVLSVNFRASTGFGKTFLNAGDHEWGRKMNDDLLDAVDWAITEGITDPLRVAIMGGSYGGYATLAAMTINPERYACGVDIVGPSNLETLMATVPPYWESFRSILIKALGDPSTESGLALLRERSPVHQADRLARPLLIGQGANDPRVKQAESDQMVAALKAKSIPVTYVRFPDEGHGFARPENNMAFNAITEHFLAAHLGGRAEPIGADELSRSTAEILEGADTLP